MSQTPADQKYLATLDFLYTSLPMFQRVGGDAFKKDLRNTWALCSRLGNPQDAFRSIHIAGTNGKGSTSHFLAAILQVAGYSTGLYTSPHLKSFTERIRINGEEISKDFVVDFVENNRDFIGEIRPSFFEITVAMAFSYFAAEKIDIGVIEVGMGGRLDSTNVITPLVSLITNIGLDHQQWLGDTIQEIAIEKGGIIKKDVPVVLGEYQPDTAPVLKEIAGNLGSDVYEAELLQTFSQKQDHWIFETETGDRITIPSEGLPGYQVRNIRGVLQVVAVLRNEGFVIGDADIVTGITQAHRLTGLKGRWQKLGSKPDVYCDVGHNPDGVRLLLEQISKQAYNHLYIVWGMVKDKDVSVVLALLPKDASYVFCEASIPRAMPAQELQAVAARHGLVGQVIKNVPEALDFCRNVAGSGDLIIVGGSNFVVAEIDLP